MPSRIELEVARTAVRRKQQANAKATATMAKNKKARLAVRDIAREHGDNPVRATADEIEEFEQNARSAQLLFAQSSGFDVNLQAFGDSRTFEALSREALAERIAAYRAAMSPTVEITACASCGIVLIGEEVHVEALHSLAALRLSDEVSVQETMRIEWLTQ